MTTYESLSRKEKDAIELALDTLTLEVGRLGICLNKTDHACRAAEALAVYIVKSRT